MSPRPRRGEPHEVAAAETRAYHLRRLREHAPIAADTRAGRRRLVELALAVASDEERRDLVSYALTRLPLAERETIAIAALGAP